MSVRKFSEYLYASAPLRDLSDRVARLRALQDTLQEILPAPLDQHAHVAGTEAGSVVIKADNGAVAAKLKQQLPTLLRKFRQKGFEVTSIRVEVQAWQPGHRPEKIKDIAITPAGLDQLRRLADTLPDSPLKHSLECLVNRHRKED